MFTFGPALRYNSAVVTYQPLLDDNPTGLWLCGEASPSAVIPAIVGPTGTLAGASYAAYNSALGSYPSGLSLTSATTETRLLTNLGASTAWLTFTAECVFRPTALTVPCALMNKTQFYAGNFQQFPFVVLLNANGSLTLNLDNGTDWVYSSSTTSSAGLVSINTTYHIAAVIRNAGVCEVYLDGVQVISATIGFSLSTSSHPFAFGGYAALNDGGSGTHGFVGALAACAIFPTALSAGRIAAHAALA